MRPQVGQVINNKYRLVRVIGDGGMGSVYEARHEVLGTTVALKFLHPELSRRQGLVQRFLQEARVSAQIQSPHVVRVSDVDQTSTGQAFIVMEYLEGKTLQTLYEELYHAGQRLSYADALEYASQMLDGVEAAHRAGVVHRDLKPDNVMITRGPKGEPLLKLLDFGIAKLKVTGELDRGLTRPGVIMGTPEYMAPEQAYSADAVDARADIFSLGVMVFEMLAGRRPVGGDEPHQIASAYLTGQIAQLTDLAPHVPPELASVVHRAMGPKPPDRYNSVAEFRSALEPFAMGTRSGAAGAAVATPLPGAVTPKPAASPAAAVTPGGAGSSPIPKTLPPTDDKPPPGVSEPSIPPPQVGATPLGGFDAPPHRQPHTSIGEPLAESLTPGPRYDATAPAAPLASHTAPPGAYDMSPRPGGTAIGQALPAGGYGPVQTNYGAAPGYPPANGYAATPGYGPTSPMNPIGGPPAHQTQQKRSGGSSVALMLLLAAAVTGVVVGGVYLGQKLTSKEEGGSDPVSLQQPPTTVVSSDPGSQQPIQTTGVVNTNPPLPQNTVPKTPTTVGGTKPPAGTTSGSGTSTPQPSASGSTAPTGIPNPFGSNGIPIPWGSTQIPLPFPMPGQQPTAQPTNTTPAPTATPTNTTPTPRPSTSGSGRPRIRIPIPGQNP